MKDQMKGINRHNNELRLTLKASIRQALLELMKHHDFESIKINDLCEKAGVSRTGFYANYKTKRDVLEESLNDIIKDIEKNAGTYDGNKGDKLFYTRLFDYIKKNRAKYRIILDANLEQSFLEKINNILLQHENLTDQEKVKRIMWAGSLLNLAAWWIKTDMKMPVTYIAQWSYDNLDSGNAFSFGSRFRH